MNSKKLFIKINSLAAIPLLSFFIANFSTAFANDQSSVLRSYVFTTTKCLTTGENNRQVKSAPGSGFRLTCNHEENQLPCVLTSTMKGATFGGKETVAKEHQILIAERNVLIAQSNDGNALLLADLGGKLFSYASRHLVIEEGMLMTKHCTGKIQIK